MINNDIWIEKLTYWVDENPIKNIETLKNGFYKNYDGNLGLPNNKKEYLSIKKLILPLGDTYKKDIPKELANLINLNELVVIARNVKEVPSEIFHLPNLKKISITIDYNFKIKGQDLKVLIDNGCQNIKINKLSRNIKDKDTIKDNKTLDYLSKNELYITSKDFGIQKNDLYLISKQTAFTDEKFSKYILKFLEKKYKFGYEAFIYANNNNEKEIDDLINFIEMDYELNHCREDYKKNILEIAISIVDILPYKALAILNDINKTYSIPGIIDAETVDLAVDIVCSIAKSEDIKKSLKYLDCIEIDYFRIDALKRLVLMSKSQEVTNTLNKRIEELKMSSYK